MAPLENDLWINALGTSMLVASVVTWLSLLAAWRRDGVLLKYEPRQPVPWGPAAATLAIMLALMAVLLPAGIDVAERHTVAPNPLETAQQLVASIFMQMMGPGLLVAVAAFSNATRRDLGVPSFAPEALARDVGMGIVVCLAAVAPVHGVQGLLLYLLNLQDELSHHPVVEMITDGEPNLVILLLATAVAVVVAPICEEITFRLLLQGWLEKWEHSKRGQNYFPEEPTIPTSSSHKENSSDPFCLGEPPRRGIAGLPYGWVPILVSSLLFAAAHYGYGPEPVPIFFLAIILGFVYQRTHRIVPCIVAHALFNLLTVFVLWRMVLLGNEN